MSDTLTKERPTHRLASMAGLELVSQSARLGDTTEPPPAQAPITGGIYARRMEWIHDGLADIELSALSVLLRCESGGNARAILDRLPRLTMAPLEEIVSEIRSTLRCGRWADVRLDDQYHHQLAAYSQGRKHQFTSTEAEAHRALVTLLRREGGLPA